jgi:4-hydroxy-tetrahydrodipicolinate reductase
MKPIRLAIAGCTGRTGGAVVRLAAADPTFQVVAGLAAAADPLLGRDVGSALHLDPLGTAIQVDCQTACDALIEFTTPAGCRQWAAWCAAHSTALVSGTTGLADSDHAALAAAARRVPVLWSPNMSIGVNVLLGLVEQVAACLGGDWDAEITEAHHRHKVDAPSGTAKALLEAICRARGVEPGQVATFGRTGLTGPRPEGQVGVHAQRMGELVGEHEVTFASSAEALTLRHRALDRQTFAAGALRAAHWLAGRAPGLYALRDVLLPATR